MNKMNAIAAALALAVCGSVAGGDGIDAALAERQWMCGAHVLSLSVYDRYYDEIVRRDLAADQAWAALKTPDEFRERQRRLRDGMVAALGGFPERTPLNLRVTETVPRNGYTIEKLLFESRPGFYVTAHRFVPDPAKFRPPYPGIVSPCGHSRSGKLAPWYQRPGVIGALNGFVTVVYDPIDQGERHQMRPSTNLLWSTTGEHNRCGRRAMLLGWNAAQFRIFDGMRAIDALVEDPRVDAGKVCVFGISGGGTLTSYLMALDDRIKVACPAGYLTTMRALCDRCGPQDAEQNFFGQLGFGLNHLGYVLMRAPSSVLMCCTRSDFFPFGGSVETSLLAERAFAAMGAPGRFGLFEVDGPHHWFESELQASVAWMKQQLGIEPEAYSANADSFKRLDVGFSYKNVDVGLSDLSNPQGHITEAGKVTPRGCVLDLPGARSVYDIMRDEAAKAVAQRGELTPAVVRAVAGIRPRGELKWESGYVRETSEGGVRIRVMTLVLPDMTRIPTVSFLPDAAKGAPVLLVSDSVRASLAPRVRSLLAEGRPVMVAELRAFGETGANRPAHARGFYGCPDGDEEVAMMCYWLGVSLVGHRAEDLIVAAQAFASLTGGAAAELRAEGRAVVPAAHAFCAERGLFASFAAERAPASWAELLADPSKPCRFANLVHGAFRSYDWPDLVR